MHLLYFLIKLEHNFLLVFGSKYSCLFLGYVLLDEGSIFDNELPEVVQVLHWVILDADETGFEFQYVSLDVFEDNLLVQVYII